MKKQDDEVHRKRFIFIISTIMIILSGLRHDYVGNDTIPYLYQFDESLRVDVRGISDMISAYINPNNESGKDPAMWILNKLIGEITTNHTIFLLVVSALFIIPLGYFLNRVSSSLLQLMFVYVLYTTLYYTFIPNSAIRQSLAIAVLLFGYLSLIEGKVKKFFILLIVASLFHKSVLLCSIIPLFVNNKSLRLYRMSIFLFLIMLVIYPYVGALLADGSDIYSKYGTNTFYGTRSKPFMILLFYIILFGLTYVKIKSFKYDLIHDREIQMMSVGSSFTLIFIPLLLLDSTLIRISAYFMLWMGLFVPLILKKYPPNIRCLIIYILVLMLLYRSFNAPEQYAFFWQQMEMPG